MNLGSILTSLGDKGCQSLLNQGGWINIGNESCWSLHWKLFWLTLFIFSPSKIVCYILKVNVQVYGIFDFLL